MAKYDPLSIYLRCQKSQTVELSFREIENLIGSMLPNKASDPAWWCPMDEPGPKTVQLKAWSEARYEAFLAPYRERVSFRRAFPQ